MKITVCKECRCSIDATLCGYTCSHDGESLSERRPEDLEVLVYELIRTEPYESRSPDGDGRQATGAGRVPHGSGGNTNTQDVLPAEPCRVSATEGPVQSADRTRTEDGKPVDGRPAGSEPADSHPICPTCAQPIGGWGLMAAQIKLLQKSAEPPSVDAVGQPADNPICPCATEASDLSSSAGVAARPAPQDGQHLRILFEIDQSHPAPIRVAAFLRQYASMIRKNERWDIPETMASAYESSALALERYVEEMAARPALARPPDELNVDELLGALDVLYRASHEHALEGHPWQRPNRARTVIDVWLRASSLEHVKEVLYGGVMEAAARIAGPAPPALARPAPPDTWRCFQCDEVFTDRAEAREHFGDYPDDSPLCLIKGQDGGLGARIRELEAEVSAAYNERNEYENDARLWHEAEADRRRRIGDCQWWQELDSREGERLVLQQRIAELEAAAAARPAWQPIASAPKGDVTDCFPEHTGGPTHWQALPPPPANETENQ